MFDKSFGSLNFPFSFLDYETECSAESLRHLGSLLTSMKTKADMIEHGEVIQSLIDIITERLDSIPLMAPTLYPQHYRTPWGPLVPRLPAEELQAFGICNPIPCQNV